MKHLIEVFIRGVRHKPNGLSSGDLTVYVEAGNYIDSNSWDAAGIYVDRINVIAYNGLVTSSQTVAKVNGQVQVGKIAYLEGIVFDGGTKPFVVDIGADEGTAIYGKNCSFNNSTNSNGFACIRSGLYIFENCRADGNDLDGFNYHNYDSVKNTLVMEINCAAKNNGVTATSNNGSTAHDEIKIIRINGDYSNNANRNIHDIEDCQSWMLGSVVSDGVEAGQPNIKIGSGDTDTSKIWLDSVTVSGSANTDLEASSTTCTIYTYDFDSGDCLDGGAVKNDYAY